MGRGGIIIMQCSMLDEKEKKLLKNIDSSSFRSANYLSNSYHSAPQGVECIHAQVGRSLISPQGSGSGGKE